MSNVLIYESSPIILSGIANFIIQETKNWGVYSSTNIDDMCKILADKKIDFVLLSTADESSLGTVIQHIDPSVAIAIYYSSFTEAIALLRKFPNIKGLISKEADTSDFMKCIETMNESKQVFCPASWDRILEQYLSGPVKPSSSNKIVESKMDESEEGGLTKRQSEIAELLKQGKKTSEIADILHIKPSTVSSLKFTIFKKLNVSNLVELLQLKDIA